MLKRRDVKPYETNADTNESNDSDIIDTTPDNSKKLKLRISKINSRLKNSSSSQVKIENNKKNEESKTLLDSISPIPKLTTNSRKLCLKKPLKRRCSFSPKDINEKKKQKQLQNEVYLFGNILLLHIRAPIESSRISWGNSFSFYFLTAPLAVLFFYRSIVKNISKALHFTLYKIDLWSCYFYTIISSVSFFT